MRRLFEDPCCRHTFIHDILQSLLRTHHPLVTVSNPFKTTVVICQYTRLSLLLLSVGSTVSIFLAQRNWVDSTSSNLKFDQVMEVSITSRVVLYILSIGPSWYVYGPAVSASSYNYLYVAKGPCSPLTTRNIGPLVTVSIRYLPLASGIFHLAYHLAPPCQFSLLRQKQDELYTIESQIWPSNGVSIASRVVLYIL